MKQVIRGTIHFLSAIFLFFIVGMALSLLLIQNQFIDMRFDSEFVITVMTVTGIWFFFARVFMNAHTLALWEKKWISLLLAFGSLALILIITILEGSISIMPAYMARKALFMENALTLSNMNTILIVGLVIGALMLIMSHRKPLSLKKETKMEWSRLSRGNRIGMMSLFALLAVFILVYMGQGGIHAAINHSVVYLKNADVEGFRDYLLSFGPLAAVVSGLLMVFQSVVAPLPAFVITFANGLLFGWFFGAILSWSSAMLGAVICFYLAKFLGRPVVEKIVTKKALEWWDQFFAKYGKHSVFIARLVPIVSFDLVSYAAGVTSVSFWEFFWATGLGQLPATILYSFLGQNATNTVKILFFLFTIVIALAVIGMLLRPKIQQLINRKKGVKR
ncbi:TVP38/TMEM64 family protein [Bacillus sp. 1NLA3E]|uniref:TVP38/TMEM64 family protein n=1 Tax=Bacillus sp. 1NLA3E TaxID=666686 RepID=UPI000247EA60|nr:TVP38/TMEM64 family protein [Bacillus sp. 1NLA3E]AGK52425.1 alkaline phosphatase [Bacillus sp. 1NLA3E]